MNERDGIRRERFYRSSDRAVFAGVCAGAADYFGFNLRATRFLTILGFIFAFPATLLIYVAAAILFPSAPTGGENPEFRRQLRSSPRQTMQDVRARFRSLDRRLARLEKYVTSSRYQLDREFRDLESR